MTFPKCLLAFQPTLLNPDTQTLGRVSSLGMALSPGVVSSSLSSRLKGGQGWSWYLIPFTSALHPMPHDSSFQATACLLKQTQSGGQEKLGSSGTLREDPASLLPREICREELLVVVQSLIAPHGTVLSSPPFPASPARHNPCTDPSTSAGPSGGKPDTDTQSQFPWRTFFFSPSVLKTNN